jgi:Na+/H+ antiporter NhaD/arsenite permease-like protein
MGLLTLVEDRPTPKAVYNWRVYAAACVASWASCMIGYDSAFIGTTLALPSFVSEFRLAPTQMPAAELALTKANIVSVYQAGAFFGALGAYVSSHYFGRKKSLLFWTAIVRFNASAITSLDTNFLINSSWSALVSCLERMGIEVSV